MAASWSRRLLRIEAQSLCTAAGAPPDVAWLDAVALRRTADGVLLHCEGVRAAELVALRVDVALAALPKGTQGAVTAVLAEER